MNLSLIAPCGMNCGTCIAYLREKNKCLGCRVMSESKPGGCKKCAIINCNFLKENEMKFCSDECDKYPCRRLKDLDNRYRKKYGMSMLENLDSISKLGIKKFVANEKIRWQCLKCKDTLCVHRDNCLNCEKKR